jgi:hypothetical protein
MKMSMFVSNMPDRGCNARGAPGWLKLDADEQFIQHFGSCCSSSRSGGMATILTGFMGAGTYIATAMISDVKPGSAGSRDLGDWIAIGVGAVLLISILISVLMLKRNRLQAVLTERRVLFREKGRLTQVALRDITKLTAANSGGELLVQFHVRRQRGPVASLPVKDPEEVIRQIEELAIAAGAELK